uniref:Uncharacterized protein n=1 Tax=Glossina brevipalpis TaxID=37001 RepID=A0A1A9WKA8_9MUSC
MCLRVDTSRNLKVSSVELLKREFGSFATVVIIGNWVRIALIEDKLLVINAVVVVGIFVVAVIVEQKVVLESLK